MRFLRSRSARSDIDQMELYYFLERLVEAYGFRESLSQAVYDSMDSMPDGNLKALIGTVYEEVLSGESPSGHFSNRIRELNNVGLIAITVARSLEYMEETDCTDRAVLDVLLKEVRYRKYKNMSAGIKKNKKINSTEVYEWMFAMIVYCALSDAEFAVEKTLDSVSESMRLYVKKFKKELMTDPVTDAPYVVLSEIGPFKQYSIALKKLYLINSEEADKEELISAVTDARRACEIERKKEKNKKGKMIATGVGAMLVAVVIQGMIYFDMLKEEKLKQSLSQALYVTVNEVYSDNVSGTVQKKEDSNILLATFMQAMLQRVDDDVDLTVKVITKDEKNRLVEVEAVGEYMSSLKQKHKVAVRRKIAF